MSKQAFEAWYRAWPFQARRWHANRRRGRSLLNAVASAEGNSAARTRSSAASARKQQPEKGQSKLVERERPKSQVIPG